MTETAAAQAANYPFCTIEPNVGRVAVPDPRLDKIAAIAKSAQEIETEIEFVDIAGLVRGASKGEGLGNQFLANILEVDAIVHVLRCFEGGDVTHVEAPPGSGAIRFEDPRLPLMMAAPTRPDTYITVEPRAGLLLFWESWLRHEVLPGTGRGERLSISFNFA